MGNKSVATTLTVPTAICEVRAQQRLNILIGKHHTLSPTQPHSAPPQPYPIHYPKIFAFAAYIASIIMPIAV